ncbi:fimbria/pilus periplasmic chaperone [Providencia hangzhouensis]|uniref:fimbria/pilus periplasmic chaperone n=1 Tax=Providencia hangzhouensis TaxID=3031799 RepID=UPI0034DD77F6
MKIPHLRILKAPFYLSPPIVKIEGLQGQQLKIKKTPGKLSDNVESVFFLNVLDIPKTPESAKGKNVIQLATLYELKFFLSSYWSNRILHEVINHASYQIKK